jgi:hypothetical protein
MKDDEFIDGVLKAIAFVVAVLVFALLLPK